MTARRAGEAHSEREGGLERQLSSWQQGMIAIGGTVGVGLFLGSGATIGLAGPGVVVSYLVAAVVALALGLVLAELTAVHPVAGSFGVYAERYIGPWAGFATRLTYWFAEIFAMGAMVTAVGVYFGFWFPDVPSYVFIVLAAAASISLNALQVGRFGTLDASFSSIKVAAIVAFLVTGCGIALGLLGGGEPVGVVNLLSDGGFFPNGVTGVWLSLALVLPSFLGIEAVAITSGEARRPETSVPRALVGTVLALVLLYGLAMLVIVTVSPWRAVSETSGTLTGSPFVRVFTTTGIPYAADIMNFVVVSAALTGAISHLYLATRMLFSLARAGHVPAPFGEIDARGVPLKALAGSTVGMIVAVVLAARGQQVFLPMYGMAVVALLSVWMLILFCHARFRRTFSPESLASLRVRVPGHPVPSLAAAGLILVSLSATPWVAGLEWTVPMFSLWLLVVAALYVLRRSKRLPGGRPTS